MEGVGRTGEAIKAACLRLDRSGIISGLVWPARVTGSIAPASWSCRHDYASCAGSYKTFASEITALWKRRGHAEGAVPALSRGRPKLVDSRPHTPACSPFCRPSERLSRFPTIHLPCYCTTGYLERLLQAPRATTRCPLRTSRETSGKRPSFRRQRCPLRLSPRNSYG